MEDVKNVVVMCSFVALVVLFGCHVWRAWRTDREALDLMRRRDERDEEVEDGDEWKH